MLEDLLNQSEQSLEETKDSVQLLRQQHKQEKRDRAM